MWQEGRKRELRSRNKPKAEKGPRHSHFSVLGAGAVREPPPLLHSDGLLLRTRRPGLGADLGALHPGGGSTTPRTHRPERSRQEWGQKLSQKQLSLGPGPCQLLRLCVPFRQMKRERHSFLLAEAASPGPGSWIWQGEPGLNFSPQQLPCLGTKHRAQLDPPRMWLRPGQ